MYRKGCKRQASIPVENGEVLFPDSRQHDFVQLVSGSLTQSASRRRAGYRRGQPGSSPRGAPNFYKGFINNEVLPFFIYVYFHKGAPIFFYFTF